MDHRMLETTGNLASRETLTTKQQLRTAQGSRTKRDDSRMGIRATNMTRQMSNPTGFKKPTILKVTKLTARSGQPTNRGDIEPSVMFQDDYAN